MGEWAQGLVILVRQQELKKSSLGFVKKKYNEKRCHTFVSVLEDLMN